MNREALTAQLVRHEGLRLKPYRDTVGKLTIGIGRNLDDRGISREEAFTLCANDIALVEQALRRALPWIATLDDVRQRVLANMGFNMGVPTLLSFQATLEAVRTGDYRLAAERMLASKWAGQVGGRAVELSRMMATGRDQVP